MQHIVRNNDAAEVKAFNAFIKAAKKSKLVPVIYDSNKIEQEDVVPDFEKKLATKHGVCTGVAYFTLLFYYNSENVLVAVVDDEENDKNQYKGYIL